MTKNTIVAKTLSFLLLLICFGCEQKPPYRIPKYPEIEQDIFFEGEYPPVALVEYEENGQVYHVDAVQGQVMVMFEETVSHTEAFEILKNNHVKIVAQLPQVHYYLVEVPVGMEGKFMCLMRKIPKINFVCPNAIDEICSVDSYVLDNFHGTHGNRVVLMMKDGYPGREVRGENVGTEDGEEVYFNQALESAEKIIGNLGKDESVVINMSFGPGVDKDIKDVEKRCADYKKAYIDELNVLKELVLRHDDKDFVIVKSSGNKGVKNLEDGLNIFRDGLSKEELEVFEHHFILVSAKDSDRLFKDGTRLYNDVSPGYYDRLVTKVDISDVPWDGTSFSSPRVAGYIVTAADAHGLKVTEVLEYVRKATEEALDHVLTPELLEKVIEDDKTPMSEVTIEGVLRMYIVNNTYDGMEGYGSYGAGDAKATNNPDLSPYCYRVNEYCETDDVNNYLAFVVETDKAVDVTPYFDEWDKDNLKKSSYTAFMVGFQNSQRDFALKYANKRVRVTGTFHLVIAGWRYATDVVMETEKIALCETEKMTSNQGIPSDLVEPKRKDSLYIIYHGEVIGVLK